MSVWRANSLPFWLSDTDNGLSQQSIFISTLNGDRGVYTYVCILLLVFEAAWPVSYLEHCRVKGAFHNGVRVPSIDRENERGRKKGKRKKFYAWCIVCMYVYIYIMYTRRAPSFYTCVTLAPYFSTIWRRRSLPLKLKPPGFYLYTCVCVTGKGDSLRYVVIF